MRSAVPALGAWMMLRNLTDERTQTVLPISDSLYVAAQLELGRPRHDSNPPQP